VIVAIDAASMELGVALAEPDGDLVAADAWSSPQRQSAELLPRLLALLDAAGRDLSTVSAVAVGTGPGSFTGLRVAMAIAKGLAVGLGRPLVGVPSLPAWLEAAPEAAAALARAGAREAYLLPRGAEAPVVVDRDGIEGDLRNAAVVAADELAIAFGLSAATGPRGAPVIARQAARRLTVDPAGDDVGRLEPIYLRQPRGVAARAEGEVRWL
jgi:tRNA threonylcarbamoyl adenosine modification protein YeaZ